MKVRENGRGFLCLALLLISPAVAPAATQTPLPTATPESVGLSSERLRRIGDRLRDDIDNGRIPGAVVAIARRGKLVYFEAFGYRDKANNVRMTTDTIFPIASMTKAMVSIGALMLNEEGRLNLVYPVSKYLPPMGKMQVAVASKTDPWTGDAEEIRMRVDPATGETTVETTPAQNEMTIHDLMRHTSGLTYGFSGETAVHKLYPQRGADEAAARTSEEFIDHLSTLPLLYQPGTRFEYGISHEVLGVVIETIAKKRLGEYLEEVLFRPLQMKDTSFYVPAGSAARYARPLSTDPETGKPQVVVDLTKPLKFECGGGCAASTASDYLRFAQMLLNGGTLDGHRIVGRKTVEYMTSDHLGAGIDARSLDTDAESQGYGFGLGVAVRRAKGNSVFVGSAGDYLWYGSFGTQFFVDPKEQLVAVFLLTGRGSTSSRYRTLFRGLVMQAIVD